jgi:hypothetical protein
MAEVESSILHTGKQLKSLEKLHFRTVIVCRYRCRTQARFDGLKPAHTSTTLLSCTAALQADVGLAAEQPPALSDAPGVGREATLQQEPRRHAVAEVLAALEPQARAGADAAADLRDLAGRAAAFADQGHVDPKLA